MDVKCLMRISVFVTVLAAANPVQWTPESLPEGALLYACAGQTVQFPWNITTASGDVISAIRWLFGGRSEEVVAIFVNGNFQSMPSFSHRVQHVPEAGFSLDHVLQEDAGNYTVEVNGHDGNNGRINLRHTAILKILVDPVNNQTLQVRQETEAEHSNTTDQWHAVLSCGHFPFAGHPPFTVDWVTPDGAHIPSTNYTDGYFRLLLPNPLIDGSTYTCRVSRQSLLAYCIHGNAGEATLAVDAVQGRLSILEAKLISVQTENSDLKNKVTLLTSDNQGLHKEMDSLQEKSNRTVAFHATHVHSSTWLQDDDIIVLDDVTTNIGDAYNVTTGVFECPYSGLYVFLGLAAPSGGDGKAYVKLVVNGTGAVSYCRAYQSGYMYQTGTCLATLWLSAGQQVWMAGDTGALSHLWSDHTFFSGFLLSTDH